MGKAIFEEFYDKEQQQESYNELYDSLNEDQKFWLTLFMGRLHSTSMLGYSNDKKKEGK